MTEHLCQWGQCSGWVFTNVDGMQGGATPLTTARPWCPSLLSLRDRARCPAGAGPRVLPRVSRVGQSRSGHDLAALRQRPTPLHAGSGPCRRSRQQYRLRHDLERAIQAGRRGRLAGHGDCTPSQQHCRQPTTAGHPACGRRCQARVPERRRRCLVERRRSMTRAHQGLWSAIWNKKG